MEAVWFLLSYVMVAAIWYVIGRVDGTFGLARRLADMACDDASEERKSVVVPWLYDAIFGGGQNPVKSFWKRAFGK